MIALLKGRERIVKELPGGGDSSDVFLGDRLIEFHLEVVWNLFNTVASLVS
jgi:hypothetical protein